MTDDMESKTEKSSYLFRGTLAGTELVWRFRFPDTEEFLRRWIEGPAQTERSAAEVTDRDFAEWAEHGNRIDGFAEFCLLCRPTSEALLPSGQCVFHAAAVRYRDRAWLIAASSGTGKTTQVRALTELWPDEIAVINGDKPVLACGEDRRLIVHPSPWNGKEGWHGAAAAPLGGLFLLRRGGENAVRPMTQQEAAAHVYPYVFQSWRDGSVMRLAGEMTERILKCAPVWLLTSRDIPDTAGLIAKTMKREAEKYGV